MFLKMYVGKILVAKSEIEFIEMESLKEKTNHAKKLAQEMLIENLANIRLNKFRPIFFIDRVPSKMNDEDFESVLTEEEMMLFRKAVAKQFMKRVA